MWQPAWLELKHIEEQSDEEILDEAREGEKQRTLSEDAIKEVNTRFDSDDNPNKS